ncbi:MAG: phosphoribosylglycinamide synthetase C domain-containing protein, partial [Nioella sp.]
YNVRFGDPEWQCLMLRLGAQALDLMLGTAEGRLVESRVTWAEDHAMAVVMAARGYPGAYEKGSEIKGLQDMPETSFEICFHAGTTREAGRDTASGGRVLALTARGDTLQDARDRAYGLVARVDWPEGFCRSDIGWRALSG